MLEIVIFVALAVCFCAIALLLWINKKNKVIFEQKNQELAHLLKQNSIVRSEIEELRGGVLSIGKRVLQVEKLGQELSQGQQQLASYDPGSKIYSRAVKMIELGAELDEIMKECELPRAEAELLVSLHQQKG